MWVKRGIRAEKVGVNARELVGYHVWGVGNGEGKRQKGASDLKLFWVGVALLEGGFEFLGALHLIC
jgi:hypothetical protein